MRINNADIEKIVQKLLLPISEKCTLLEGLKKDIIEEYISRDYPAEIKVLIANKSKYLNTQTYIYARCGGQSIGVNFPQGVVAKNRDVVIEDVKCAEQLQAIVNEISVSRQKYVQLGQELTATLQNLRTHEKISKNFPEAAKFLPTFEERNLPALNISDIQNKLKDLP